MCSYPHLQYHFGQYELDCHRRDTPREVHEQRFAGSSFAHHLLQSNTNFQALLLADAQSRILTVLPAVAQRFRLGVASFAFSARVSGREVTWLLRRLFGSGQRAGTLCFFRRERQCMIGAAEPRQSCKPLSVLICAEHDVSVLGSSFETALLKFFK